MSWQDWVEKNRNALEGLKGPGAAAMAWDHQQARIDELEEEAQQNPDEETLAAWCHDQWAHWMRYMMPQLLDELRRGGYPASCDAVWWLPCVQRWYRQMNAPYSELSEKEKESDREQARKLKSVLEA